MNLLMILMKMEIGFVNVLMIKNSPTIIKPAKIAMEHIL